MSSRVSLPRRSKPSIAISENDEIPTLLLPFESAGDVASPTPTQRTLTVIPPSPSNSITTLPRVADTSLLRRTPTGTPRGPVAARATVALVRTFSSSDGFVSLATEDGGFRLNGGGTTRRVIPSASASASSLNHSEAGNAIPLVRGDAGARTALFAATYAAVQAEAAAEVARAMAAAGIEDTGAGSAFSALRTPLHARGLLRSSNGRAGGGSGSANGFGGGNAPFTSPFASGHSSFAENGGNSSSSRGTSGNGGGSVNNNTIRRGLSLDVSGIEFGIDETDADVGGLIFLPATTTVSGRTSTTVTSSTSVKNGTGGAGRRLVAEVAKNATITNSSSSRSGSSDSLGRESGVGGGRGWERQSGAPTLPPPLILQTDDENELAKLYIDAEPLGHGQEDSEDGGFDHLEVTSLGSGGGDDIDAPTSLGSTMNGWRMTAGGTLRMGGFMALNAGGIKEIRGGGGGVRALAVLENVVM